MIEDIKVGNARIAGNHDHADQEGADDPEEIGGASRYVGQVEFRYGVCRAREPVGLDGRTHGDAGRVHAQEGKAATGGGLEEVGSLYGEERARQGVLRVFGSMAIGIVLDEDHEKDDARKEEHAVADDGEEGVVTVLYFHADPYEN